MSIDAGAIKQGQKMMWSMGDYPDLARNIEGAAEVLVERVGAAPGRGSARRRHRHRQRRDPAALTGAQRHRPRHHAPSCSRSPAAGRARRASM